MRRNVVLSVYNRAKYLNRTQAIIYEKRVDKLFIFGCDLLHVQTLLHVHERMRVRSHTSTERVCG